MAGGKYISSREAAAILNVSTRRVVGLCNEGYFAGSYQQGRGWKIPEEEVYLYLNAGRGDSGKESLLSCAVGNTSFIDVVQSSYYVDKTLLIRDLIDDHAAVTLFTRPRRFGKTLNMDMIRVFFEKTDAHDRQPMTAENLEFPHKE